ncbi:MAG: hypothetical protein R3F65_10000 [bacterium]
MPRLGHALIAIALLALACSDPAPSGDRGDDAGGPDYDVIPVGDSGLKPETDQGGGPDMLPPADETRHLALLGDIDRFALLGTQLQLQFIYSRQRGANPPVPIEGGRVSFKLYDENGIEQPTGVDGSRLRSGSAQTDANGIATADIQIGDIETYFELEATASGAERSQRYTITVGRDGVGALQIRIAYDPAVSRYAFRDLQNAEVFLFDNQNCGQIAQEPTQIFGAFIAVPRDPFDSVDNQVNIRDLEDGMRFSVAAVAYNLRDNTVAFGCVDAVEVIGGRTTGVDVPLLDLPLEFKGRFRVVHRFDLTEMLRSSENETLNTVADVLDILRIIGSDDGERGRAIVELLCGVTGIDENLCDIIEPIAGRLVDTVIDNFLVEQAPEVFAVLRGISDVLTILTDMTIIGEIEFLDSTPDAQGWLYQNESRWQKFRFRWRNGCPPGSPCIQEFTIGELHNDGGANRPRPIFGNFDARLEGPRLQIPPHTYTVRYATILLALAETWVIPAILGEPGPVTLDEVLADILPCDDIDEVIGDGNCQLILVEGIAEVIYEQISRLEFASDDFTLAGSVEPVDDDGDLVIDRLIDGTWNGIIGNELHFPGCFTGCRGLDCEPPPCIIPGQQQ